MNRTMTILFLAAALATSAAWADRGRGGPSPEDRVARMAEHLALTESQEVEVLTLMEETRAQFQDDRAAGREAFETGLQSILTDEQLVEFQAHREERRDRRDRRRPDEQDTQQ